MNNKTVSSWRAATVLATKFEHIKGSLHSTEDQRLFEKQAFFAGGCVADTSIYRVPNDFDIFFRTQTTADYFYDGYPGLKSANYEFKARSNTCVTYLDYLGGPPIQLINKRFGPPNLVVAGFDFEHCQNFYDPVSKQVYMKNEKAIEDKVLIFNEFGEFPVKALARMIKFMSRGWSIDTDNLGKIARAISRLHLDNEEVMRTQCEGLYLSEIKGISAEDLLRAAVANIPMEIPF